MRTNFIQNGIRYNIQLRPVSFRERESIAENIKPDRSLWTNACKKAAGIPEDPIKIVRASRDRSHYAKPHLKDFEECAPLD